MGCNTAKGEEGAKTQADITRALWSEGKTIRTSGYLSYGANYRFGGFYFNLEDGPRPTNKGLPNLTGADTIRETTVHPDGSTTSELKN